MADDFPRDGHVGAGEAEVAAADLAVPQQLGDHPADGVDRGGEADPLRHRDDRRVHADHLAAGIDERPARVAGVERGVGLDDVVDQPPAVRAQAAAERAHHAGGDRVLEAVRVADRDRELADAQAARRPERRGRKAARPDADHRDVGVRIIADDVRVVARAVREARADRFDPMDHVAVGQDQAVRGEHEPGARAAALAPAARLLDLEVGNGGPDALGGSNDRPGVGVEQPGVAVAGPAGRGGAGRPRRAGIRGSRP